ncbi:MAG: tRNA pseudouridine(38-40) synthase TruA [Proteobacteria bacterium]|nr:tRNA pseudouridine(38-40) synthase TruA [Pseudomonadota bacterium]MBU4462943.1 tRNA pseudouridine(38-40) synthase TruA [Pseudomonadota bacterium]
MLNNFKLTIEYDGTEYQGWQSQKNGRTIQEVIENAINIMTGKKVSLTGSGRTDAGVHALGQTANFHCNTELGPETFQKGLNSLVPDDIVIKECCLVDDKFHARYDAKSKTYYYKILNQRLNSAISRRYVWHIRKTLNLEAMHLAISHILGTHDFKAFEGSGSPRSNTIRTVINATLIEPDQNNLSFQIEANGFLRYMVRNIVGTLVEVGLGKITPEDFKTILLSRDRNRAGATAPPHGLFLVNVKY